MSNATKIIIGITVFIVALIVMFSLQKPKKEETIKIGVLGSLTGSYAAYGEGGKRAIEIGADEINSKGGIDGKKIKLIIEDTQNDAKIAASAAQKLINVDKVVAILTDSSTITLTVAPIAEQNKVPVMGYISTSPVVSGAGDYIFRTSPSNVDGMIKLANFAIEKFNYRKISIISELKDYPQGIREVFVKNFEELGGSIAIDETFESKATDVRTQLLKIKESNSEAILILAQSSGTGALLLKQVKEVDLNLPILANEAVASVETIKLIGEAAEGVISVEPDFDISNETSANLIKKYEEKGYSAPPQWLYVATAYDALYIIAEAIKEVGMDGESIKDYLYTIRDREGAVGKLTFDENGDPKLSFSIRVIKDGELVRYEE